MVWAGVAEKKTKTNAHFPLKYYFLIRSYLYNIVYMNYYELLFATLTKLIYIFAIKLRSL